MIAMMATTMRISISVKPALRCARGARWEKVRVFVVM
jgi:hypothetical protein